MNYQITADIAAFVINLRKKASQAEVKRQLSQKTGWGKTKCNEAYNRIICKGVAPEPVKEKLEFDTEVIETNDRYTYNSDTDKYIVYIPSAGKNVVFDGSLIRAMLKFYTGGGTLNELARNFKLPRPYVFDLITKLGWTHSALPKTDEEISTTPTDTLVEDMLEEKKFEVWQRFQKLDWKAIQEDALKWRGFKSGQLNPFEDFLSNWTPPTSEPLKYINLGKSGDDTFVIGLSDLHFGAYADSSKLYSGKGTNTEAISSALVKYLSLIKADIGNRVIKPGKAVILGLGDVLHSLNGYTVKGTQLKTDCVNEKMFEKAFNSIYLFISEVLASFPDVEVHSVVGNHFAFGDWALFETLKGYFNSENRIEFHNHKTDHAAFRVNNTLVVISHGYSAEYSGRLKGGPGRENWIQTILLTHPELLIGVKEKIFISADQHHNESKEYADFTHYMFPTAMESDEHAEASLWKSRASQNCLVIGDNGVSALLKFNLD